MKDFLIHDHISVLNLSVHEIYQRYLIGISSSISSLLLLETLYFTTYLEIRIVIQFTNKLLKIMLMERQY